MGSPTDTAVTDGSCKTDYVCNTEDGKKTANYGEDEDGRFDEQRPEAVVEQAFPVVQPQMAVENAAVQRKKLATAAAIAAVCTAAPGQRERVVADAVHAASADAATPALQKESVAVPDQSLGMATVTDGEYQPPDWGEKLPMQDSGEVSIDVLKNGMLISNIRIVSDKIFVTLGRSPDADVRVEHASTSRLHAILQFCRRAVYLVDLGSTHGSALNNRPLEPFLFHRVEVGSQFRLGQSTRSYVFNAPQEWQLPEGPNMDQRERARKEKAVLERVAAAAERDRVIAEKTMQAALRGRSSWDVEAVDMGGTDVEIDWRARMEIGTLNEKQVKIAESIRSKEYKFQKTQDAAKKLRSREGPDQDLTPGQAAALLNNEKAIDRLQQELDDLEETMQESLRDSFHGRQAQDKTWQRRKQSRQRAASESDGDDEYFDRTQHKKPNSNGQAVLTVKSLVNKLQELRAEELRLDGQLQALD